MQAVERTMSNFSDEVQYYHQPKRPKFDVVTENVTLALGGTKTSSRSRTHILAATAISVLDIVSMYFKAKTQST